MIDKKKILVVGGVGFVGSNLCHYILKHHAPKELWIIDNLLSSDMCNLPNDPRVNFIFGSVADDRILQQLPSDLEIIFHLACYHGNQSSISDPIADHENNTLTSLKLFEFIKNFNYLEKVVYAAAGCAVAEKTFNDAIPTLEDAPVSLFHDSPYSISKLIGEMYGNYYWHRYQLPFVKARFQNVYGPREILGAGRWRGTPHTVWRNVVPTFIWKSLKGEALPLDNGGNSSRDFIYVEDLVRGLVACAQRGSSGEAYNLASGVETSIYQLAFKINAITKNIKPPEVNPARDWDRSGRRFGSTEKSSRELEFTASISIDDGLEKTVEWTLNNIDLIQRVIDRHNGFMKRL